MTNFIKVREHIFISYTQSLTQCLAPTQDLISVSLLPLPLPVPPQITPTCSRGASYQGHGKHCQWFSAAEVVTPTFDKWQDEVMGAGYSTIFHPWKWRENHFSTISSQKSECIFQQHYTWCVFSKLLVAWHTISDALWIKSF